MVIYFVLVLFFGTSAAVRINFTSCQNPEWSCVNNVPNEIVYTCSVVRSNDFVIHLKDYYTDHITSVTIQNCKELKVILDCPLLQRASQLQRFIIKNAETLEFTSLSSGSLVQTPPEVVIENVKEILSLPRNLFKSPSSNTERKCLGATSMKRILISNCKINTIRTRAIHNVTDIKSIEFENVTIANIQTQGIEAIMNGDNTVFTLIDTKIDKIELKGLAVQSTIVTISEGNFGDITSNSVNVTADHLQIVENRFKQISPYGLALKSVDTDINRNHIGVLKTNALSNIKCARKRTSKNLFNFRYNTVENVEPYSLIFDYTSCEVAGASVSFTNNKIDCTCRNILFLNSATTNADLNSIILDVSNNNTCLSAPCVLPLDIVKLLLESDILCQLNLDTQVMCLLYSDRHSTNEVTTDEVVTEPAPTFYLIRQANSPNGVAAMTAVNKDDLLRDSNLNMTNRTAIKVVFDSSRDFVETLRSTSNSRNRPVEEPKTPPNDEYINRCVGPHCRNNVAYDRQKALDFYKYVYAQLRPPRHNDKKKT